VFNSKKSYEREVNHHTGRNVTNFVSDDILESAGLAKQCVRMICVDSAMGHISRALNKKTFVVFFRKVWSKNSVPFGDVSSYVMGNDFDLIQNVKDFVEIT